MTPDFLNTKIGVQLVARLRTMEVTRERARAQIESKSDLELFTFIMDFEPGSLFDVQIIDRDDLAVAMAHALVLGVT